jgi:two-component system chemotaxis response regulator CheV
MAQTNILLESGTNELEIVEFYLDERLPSGEKYTGYYGVNVAKVLEIIRLPKVTEMPQTPHPCVMGTFNLRNKVVPLVDLCDWLGKERYPSDTDKVVVTEFNNIVNAFLVSGVNRIHRLSWERIDPPNKQVSVFSGESITGVVRMEDRVLFILDMEKIIGDLNPNLALRALDEAAFVEERRELPDKDMVFKVLVADDSGTIRNMMVKSLERAGFEVKAAINGREAWDILSRIKDACQTQEKPLRELMHVVISDIEMPAMDGHSLTKRIKEDPVLRELPVILFSSLITESLRHKGLAVGADEQVSKPDMKILAEKARELAYNNLVQRQS